MMSLYTTKPTKELTQKEFQKFIKNKKIILGNHALDHLSNYQRGLFDPNELINSLLKETPRKLYLQENNRYRIYFRKKEGYRNIIISDEGKKMVIISFMDVPDLPKIKL
ncbi:hypothetical protein HQ545_03950 [Candidatus Woesearchaeota archaeon]|nr:hypothetical protein [Candidatus Woesearchaeota archaeon]